MTTLQNEYTNHIRNTKLNQVNEVSEYDIVKTYLGIKF